MNIQISFIGVLVLLSIGLFLAVAIMKLIASLGNSLMGRGDSGNGAGGFLSTLLTLIVVGGLVLMVGGGLFLARSKVTVSPQVSSHSFANGEVAVEIRNGALEITKDLRRGLRELENARDEVRDATRPEGLIQFEDNATETTTVTVEGGSEEAGPAEGNVEAVEGEADETTDAVHEEVSEQSTAAAEADADVVSDEGADSGSDVPIADQSGESETTENVTAIAGGDDVNGTDANAEQPSGDAELESRADAEGGDSESEPPAVSQSGNVVVFQLSDESVERLLGTKGRIWLQEFRDRLPDDFRDTYALIPLTATVGTTAPAAARPFATADRIQSVLTTVASMLPDAAIRPEPDVDHDNNTAQTAESERESDAEESLVPSKPPQWLLQPSEGQLLVESGFAPQGEDPQASESLSVAVNQALFEHIRNVANQSDDYSRNWPRMVHLRLSDDAVQDCIRDQYDLVEVLETGFGPQVMHKTVALVEFPTEIQQTALAEVRTATQRQRIAVLGLTMGLLWAGLISATIGFRIARRKSRIGRYVVAPVCLLAAVTLGGTGIGLVGATTAGEVVSTPFDELYEVVVVEGAHK